MAKYSVSPEVMEARQAWFWRRTTLQVVLAAMVFMLLFMVDGSIGRVMEWPYAVVELGFVGAICWLITMYFASVDSADKVAHVIAEAIEAVNEAQQGTPG